MIVENLEFNISYIKFNGNKFEIDSGNGNQECNICELEEMFQKFVKVDDSKDKYDDLNEVDDGCIKLEEEENKKVSDKDKKKYRKIYEKKIENNWIFKT